MVAAVSPGVAVALVAAVLLVASAPALSVLAALASVDVAALSLTAPTVWFVLVPPSAVPVSLFVASTCTCCSAVSRGAIASAMAAMGIVALTMDVHEIAQSR